MLGRPRLTATAIACAATVGVAACGSGGSSRGVSTGGSPVVTAVAAPAGTTTPAATTSAATTAAATTSAARTSGATSSGIASGATGAGGAPLTVAAYVAALQRLGAPFRAATSVFASAIRAGDARSLASAAPVLAAAATAYDQGLQTLHPPTADEAFVAKLEALLQQYAGDLTKLGIDAGAKDAQAAEADIRAMQSAGDRIRTLVAQSQPQ